jgi:hypothetical protein
VTSLFAVKSITRERASNDCVNFITGQSLALDQCVGNCRHCGSVSVDQRSRLTAYVVKEGIYRARLAANEARERGDLLTDRSSKLLMRLLPSLRWQSVEFFLEQPIDEGIDVERWTGWAANAETVIDKKAARTFQIKFNAGPAHLERLIGSWVEQST